MDRLRYTASARLGLWDSIPGDREEFLSALKRILQSSSHAVLEAEEIEFVPTDNPALAAVTAICDKIIARGNPTLVDLDFERALLNGPGRQFLRFEEIAEGPAIGMRFSSVQFPGTTADLVSAAQELLCLPYRSGSPGCAAIHSLPPQLRDLTSEEEDLFLEQFNDAFGGSYRERLHRQVLIRDLVDHPGDELVQNRVDFVFQVGPLKWVFEVDGPQHKEPAQKAKDDERDALLRRHGWSVHRISTQAVRNGLHAWFDELKAGACEEDARALNAGALNSIQAATAKSPVHAAALNCILLPLAVHRCLRGLLHLYSHEVLDSERPQRVLVVEEDISVTAEAFRMLHAIWTRIHVLAPGTLAAPSIQLDVIGDELLPGLPTVPDIDVRCIAAPEGSYDIVLSHSFLLAAGHVGVAEKTFFPNRSANLVCLRHAIGFRAERTLQWCEPLHYDLADVERSISSQNGEEPQPMPSDKHEALLFLLHLIFRKRDFWDGQLRVVSRLLQGKPSIVLLPTGGGKSLTYQLSGFLLPGMTIIIDPLVSLMTDQLDNLHAAGIDLVGFISGQLDPAAKDAVLRDMAAGRLAFTFMQPERLQIQDFRNQLQSVVARFPISLAVIDEAHCVSEWGHDFRPSYLHLPRNLQRYCSDGQGRLPTLVGLTGTASFAVLTDIQMEMHVTDEEAIILPRSFDRQELRFDVRSVPVAAKPSALKTCKMQLPRFFKSNPQRFYDLRGDRTNSGIVFCPHVNGSLGVTSVAGQLGHSNFFAGQQPKVFEGGRDQWRTHKSQVQQDFKKNRLQELVATKAFGMGIDKPNIRYTIHYVVPQSVEAFYQEAGRAGRNGTPEYALCTILYSDDNWDSALEILNEPDHQQALARLEAIKWNDRGDLLVQLWLLFNAYRGRAQEKALTLDFWNKKLAPVIAGMPVGATNTQELGFHGDRDRKTDERAIFRLMLLGVVQDYTIKWQFQRGRFAVRVQRITPVEVKENLRQYLMQYKFEDFADDALRDIPDDTVENALASAINVLIDFIYDEIVAKRKQALRTMGELCRNFTSDQDFREAILAYLQESEFSDELREWVNREFDAIGLEAIRDLLQRVTTLEEVKRLVGTARRMLDEDPQNVALRYISMCARAQSAAESDPSVLQEATTLTIQIDDRLRENIHDPDGLLVAMLDDVAARRPALLEEISDITLRRAGTVSLARRLLRSRLADVQIIYSHSLELLAAGALRTAKNCAYYAALRKEDTHA
ncbi:RecQ family ATP-dependent DNA helicase [Candidatus Bipolaricaulota bacterium]|nr:RecQ family ATP-dependent DNA helicase [Candidatus Bipolaricaulota bacterium]